MCADNRCALIIEKKADEFCSSAFVLLSLPLTREVAVALPQTEGEKKPPLPKGRGTTEGGGGIRTEVTEKRGEVKYPPVSLR